MSRGFDTGCNNKNTKRVKGIFHKLSEEMGVYLLKMCMDDALSARATGILALSKQQASNKRKEDLLRYNRFLAVNESFIIVLYSDEMLTLLLRLTGR